MRARDNYSAVAAVFAIFIYRLSRKENGFASLRTFAPQRGNVYLRLRSASESSSVACLVPPEHICRFFTVTEAHVAVNRTLFLLFRARVHKIAKRVEIWTEIVYNFL